MPVLTISHRCLRPHLPYRSKKHNHVHLVTPRQQLSLHQHASIQLPVFSLQHRYLRWYHTFSIGRQKHEHANIIPPGQQSTQHQRASAGRPDLTVWYRCLQRYAHSTRNKHEHATHIVRSISTTVGVQTATRIRPR